MRIGQAVGRVALAACILLIAASAASGETTESASDRAFVLAAAIEGPIGPASVRHIEKVVAQAAEREPEALVLRLNTPGGLADSMRQIITVILEAPVPVIGYVAPPGAQAASAGTYILYATHVAAMAPGTNVGAASPVQIGGMPGTPPADDKTPDDAQEDAASEEDAEPGKGSLAPADTMTAKMTNDAVAFIRSLAEMHGRNADWAEKAVREADSLSAEKALKQNVIEFVAPDIDRLLDAVDGRTVSVSGVKRVLATRGLPVEVIEPDTITRVLGLLSNPNLALILMMIGVYGIIFEFWNPGSLAPGVIGAISLTLGLYALNQLPLDYAGLTLIGLGVAFMVAEALTPTYGILGIGGLVAFVLGSAMLVDTDVPAYQISPLVIGAMAAISGGFLILVLGFTVRAYRHAPAGGTAALIGKQVRVIDWSGRSGHVWVDGERWRATSRTEFAAGDTARVRGMDGLTLMLDPPRDSGASAR